jgi:PBSX family phage terminase large subunit
MLWLLREIQKDPNSDYLVTAPSYKILSQSTLIKFFELCPRYLGKYREQKQEFKFKKGLGRIFFRSTESPDFLEGMTIKAAVMDEAGQSPRQAFVNIQGRLSIKQGKCLIVTTPYYFNWLYDLLQSGSDEVEIIQFASTENPFFPEEEFKRAQRLLTKEEFERRYMGLFRKREGLVYSCFSEQNIVEPFEIPDRWTRFVGMDFGFNAPFVASFIARDFEKNYYIYKEYFKTQMSLSEHKEFLSENINKESTILYPDPSRPDSIRELTLSGYRCYPVDNKIEDGIDRMIELLKSGRLKIFKTCPELIDEFTSYHYPEKKDNKAIKELPVDLYNDGMDATRYVIFNEEKRYSKNYKEEELHIKTNLITGYREVNPEGETLRERFGIVPPEIIRFSRIIEKCES